jgi:hypothetical protein
MPRKRAPPRKPTNTYKNIGEGVCELHVGGRVALIDEDMRELFKQYTWHVVKSTNRTKEYLVSRGVYAQRLVYGLDNEVPAGQVFLLKNGNNFDFRRANVMLVSRSTVLLARGGVHRDNVSGHRGVYAHRGGWRAEVTIEGKRTYAWFKNVDDAAEWRHRTVVENL